MVSLGHRSLYWMRITDLLYLCQPEEIPSALEWNQVPRIYNITSSQGLLMWLVCLFMA